jgi:hypothetical protein
MNLYTALSIIRNAAVTAQQAESPQFRTALKVIDNKLVGLERKKAWRECPQGMIPRHMYEPRQTIPDCAASSSQTPAPSPIPQ